jgi:hypothetical protein
VNVDHFARIFELHARSEVERATYLAYFYLRQGTTDFAIQDVVTWFDALHLARPNVSRLRKNLVDSGACVTNGSSRLKLHARTISRLEQEIPMLSDSDETITTQGSVLPRSLLKGTRGYIEKLGEQINASYEHNIFDGCAVLMRRLLEVLLIHTYSHHRVELLIQTAPDQFKDLKQIIADAIGNKTIGLSKSTKDVLDEFRMLGNFSAHKVIYNCRRDEIKKVAREYRAAVEELLYKSGIRI